MADELPVVPPIATPVSAPVAPVEANRTADAPAAVIPVEPVPTKPKFKLTFGSRVSIIEAEDELTARAMFNDAMNQWPKPADVNVEAV